MIALVGMPGSGKSTVGRHLARQIGWRFADSDVEIERELGESIRSYFEKAGEDSFRSLETSVLASLLERPSMVLATGGGAVLREANRKLLSERAKVVYLRATPEDLARRLRHEQSSLAERCDRSGARAVPDAAICGVGYRIADGLAESRLA